MKTQTELMQWAVAVVIVITAAVVFNCPAKAHNFWSNGEPVPPGVKSWCCDKSDAHRLAPGAVHVMQDGYHIDGLANPLPFSKAAPSPDGQYWAFFREEDGPNAHVTCFYAPINGA